MFFASTPTRGAATAKAEDLNLVITTKENGEPEVITEMKDQIDVAAAEEVVEEEEVVVAAEDTEVVPTETEAAVVTTTQTMRITATKEDTAEEEEAAVEVEAEVGEEEDKEEKKTTVSGITTETNPSLLTRKFTFRQNLRWRKQIFLVQE